MSDIKEEIKEIKKRKIIESAIKVFLKKGVNEARMEDIAKEIGYGKASLYYHFGSKNELVSHILLQGWEKLKKAMEEEMDKKKSPKELFFNVLDSLFKVVFENPDLIKFLYTASIPDFLEEKDKERIREYRDYMVKNFGRILKEGKNKGEFKDVDIKVTLEAIFGMIKSFVLAEGIKAKEKKKKEIERFISDILIG